jgi:formyl-CoA transferase/CoA:oxalate CoA-transferase
MPVNHALPLANLVVLDVSQILAGPACAMVLADMGAEVIKIEPPGSGEISRTMGTIFYAGESSTFLSLNRNKKSLALNLKMEAGRKIFLQLADRADVVVENFRPGVAERLGIGWSVLSARNPRLIYCAISGYGQTGPYRDLPGVDPLLQARSGMMSVNGEPDGRPLKFAMPVPDFNAAMLGAYGIMVALYHRERTGQGQRVEVSLLDAAVFGLIPREWDYFATGQPPARLGGRHHQLAPYETYRCADGRFIFVGVLNDAMWPRFCTAIARPDLRDDPRFSTNAARVAHRWELEAALDAHFPTRDAAAWLAALQEQDVLCAPVNDFAEALSDPQVLHNEMVVSVEHPVGGPIKVLGVPVKLSATPGSVRTAPPRLGADAQDVLARLGYSTADVARLRSEGVI